MWEIGPSIPAKKNNCSFIICLWWSYLISEIKVYVNAKLQVVLFQESVIDLWIKIKCIAMGFDVGWPISSAYSCPILIVLILNAKQVHRYRYSFDMWDSVDSVTNIIGSFSDVTQIFLWNSDVVTFLVSVYRSPTFVSNPFCWMSLHKNNKRKRFIIRQLFWYILYIQVRCHQNENTITHFLNSPAP